MRFVFFTLAIYIGVVCGALNDEDMDVVHARIVASLLPTSQASAESLAKTALGYSQSLLPDGHWADIDYQDQGRANWLPQQHIARLQDMTYAWASNLTATYHNATLLGRIHSALDFWLVNDFQCPNWWFNQISIPKSISDIYLLLTQANLNDKEIAKGNTIMLRADWRKWTGANLIDMTYVQINRGLFFDNHTLVAESFTGSWSEVKLSAQSGDDIQYDGSFHQHGPELLAGSYGAGFTHNLLSFMSASRDTVFYIPASQMDVFAHLVLDGQQWMIVEGAAFDYSVAGRASTRPNDSFDCSFPPTYLRQVRSSRASEFNAFADRLEGKTNVSPLVGLRVYYDSDYAVHRRPDFTVSVRMFSKRTINAKCVNDEGKLSRFTADGLTNVFLAKDSAYPYHDVFPVLTWTRLGGTTVAQRPLTPCSSTLVSTKATFVGGVSNGEHGAACQDIQTTSDVNARKAWFFFDAGVMALGSKIDALTNERVLTTIAAQLLTTDVSVAFANGTQVSALPMGSRVYSASTGGGVRTVVHASTGYRFGSAVDMSIANEGRWGDWDAIGVSSGNITRNLFEVYVDHGQGPFSAKDYAYLIAPNVSSVAHVEAAWASLSVIANSDNVQAVANRSAGVLSAIFWSDNVVLNTTLVAPLVSVAPTKACALTVVASAQALQVSVAQPSASGTAAVALSLVPGVVYAGDGCVQKGDVLTVTVTSPSGNNQGETVVVLCRKQ